MNIKTTFIIFFVLVSLGLSRNLAQSWPYCDQWSNNCKDAFTCRSNQCIPLSCIDTMNCASGFFCYEGRCIAYEQVPFGGRYCDQWTACSATTQCFKKKCVPLQCSYFTDCTQGFYCNEGACIAWFQKGESLGYCDQWTHCPTTHQCVNKQCIPKTCQRTTDCLQNWLCYDGICSAASGWWRRH